VRLYSTSTPGTLAQYVDVTIAQGTQASSTFPDCTGFTPDSQGTIYSGTLKNFEQTYTGYSNGIATAPAGQTSWSQNNSLVYRIQAALQSATPDTAQGASTGVHTFIWDAHSN
jgi:hypothetical protein